MPQHWRKLGARLRLFLKFFLGKVFVFFLPVLSFCEENNFKYQLSITSVFENESNYLKEWIEYHRTVGVEHFILYNNNSTDDYLTVLNPYLEEGVVELIEWPSIKKDNDGHNYMFNVQINAYTDAINRSRNFSKWLALIDIDEFIVPVVDSTIIECLEKKYSLVSGLCVNWQCYGTSHIPFLKKDSPMIGQLVMKMKWDHDWNKHSKSIVQPRHVSYCNNPHHCVYQNNHWAVDENYKKVDACPDQVSINTIRINHYWTRDEWFFFNIKIPRWKRWGGEEESLKQHADSMNVEFDGIMSRFLPAFVP